MPTASTDRDGRGLHPSRDRGRARPQRLIEDRVRQAGARVEQVTPRPARAGALVGAVLARDLMVAGALVEGPLAVGGRPGRPGGADAGAEPVTVLVLGAGELHEDDAALRLAEAVAGPG